MTLLDDGLGTPDTTALWRTAVDGLNLDQRRAVETLDGPLLVVAGPGSGKTRVLTHRIAALVATGVAPESILAVTFTNKAAEEMRERVQGLLDGYIDPDRVQRMWVSTFHSACVKILRRYAHLIDRSRSFTIVDATDARKLIGRLLDPADASQVRDLQSQISLAKNQLLSPSSLTGPRWHPRLASIWRQYQTALAEQDLLDFDDLLLFALSILSSNPEVTESYRNQFSHILVDEFQDTNPVQYSILRQLAGTTVCAVGDVDQAIYSWRGSTPEVMAAFERDWPDTQVVLLGQNYRSTPEVLTLAQAIIDQNPAHHRVRLSTTNPSAHPVEMYTAYSDLDEADHVASTISTSTLTPSSHAIIYRTKAQSLLFEQALRTRGIPYRLIGDVAFYDRAEVRDTLAWLRVAMNPRNREALRRAAGVPRRGIGETTMTRLLEQADTLGVTPAEAFATDPSVFRKPGRDALASFFTDVDTVATATADGPGAAIDAVFAIDGFLAAATTRDEDSVETRRENVAQLASDAVQFESGTSVNFPSSTLAEMSGIERCEAYLTEASLLSSSTDDDVDACQLMTAHAAKGREFDSVFVVGCEAGLFPHSSAMDEAGIEEERRLLFVAVSRARTRLRLSWARSRFRFKEREMRDLTPFLVPCCDLYTETASSHRSGGWGVDRPLRPRGHTAASVPRRYDPLAKTSRTPPGPTIAAATVPDGPRLAAEQLCVGAKVTHSLYGDGVVERFDAEVAHIKFTSGLRTMMLAAAPLTLQ